MPTKVRLNENTVRCLSEPRREALEESMPIHTLSGTFSLQKFEKINICCLNNEVGSILFGSLNKVIHLSIYLSIYHLFIYLEETALGYWFICIAGKPSFFFSESTCLLLCYNWMLVALPLPIFHVRIELT